MTLAERVTNLDGDYEQQVQPARPAKKDQRDFATPDWKPGQLLYRAIYDPRKDVFSMVTLRVVELRDSGWWTFTLPESDRPDKKYHVSVIFGWEENKRTAIIRALARELSIGMGPEEFALARARSRESAVAAFWSAVELLSCADLRDGTPGAGATTWVRRLKRVLFHNDYRKDKK